MMFKKIIKSILQQTFSSHQYKHKPHYTSSDHYYKYKSHPSQYGHFHYKKKHHSGSFFSSFFGS